VSVCCQRGANVCEGGTTAEISEIDGWYWSCAYETYPNQRFVLGTCGADGVGVPAH